MELKVYTPWGEKHGVSQVESFMELKDYQVSTSLRRLSSGRILHGVERI
ncbi:hypothetical protein Mcup_1125 [Metallosphaera cuprina Ar-4]|uniref:Uncharacterized protein n=1 Tax=Metallosphaera cuprina (strain Ar-4) TaxID=1006006 RepID=F4G332_METCR|nr:hypothetical protein Mcup_1125 [Metallosphaera cuprina Ar-4]